MLDPSNSEMIARVVQRLSALADENRIRILLCLRDSERNVTELTGQVGLAQASVSKHLAILRSVGLIDVERRGTQAFYRIKDQSVFDMCKLVCDGVIRQAKQQTAALGLKVQGPGRTRSTV